ncbi:MAG: HNH endonuclease [Pseudomonadota bacterium]|nr:HNH endonuclease [Pseudomonadota bacterium]
MPGDDEGATCWLCHRAIASRVQWHHPVPRARKGRATVPVHPICHRTIHAHFTNAQLARIGDDRDRLAREPAVARFLEWIADKPPDFHAPTRGGPARGGRRR